MSDTTRLHKMYISYKQKPRPVTNYSPTPDSHTTPLHTHTQTALAHGRRASECGSLPSARFHQQQLQWEKWILQVSLDQTCPTSSARVLVILVISSSSELIGDIPAIPAQRRQEMFTETNLFRVESNSRDILLHQRLSLSVNVNDFQLFSSFAADHKHVSSLTPWMRTWYENVPV